MSVDLHYIWHYDLGSAKHIRRPLVDLTYLPLVRELLEAAIVGLHNQGTISNDVMHRIEHDLDRKAPATSSRVLPPSLQNLA